MDEHRQMKRREWVTVDECADYLRRSNGTIHRYIRRGVLRASQIVAGGRVMVNWDSVQAALNRNINRPVRRNS